MLNVIKTIALGATLALTAGCASEQKNYQTHLEADSSYNYQQLSSFSITPKQFIGTSKEAENDVFNSVKSVLTNKGYQFVEGKGDFSVEFYGRRKEGKKMVIHPISTPAGQFTDYRMEDFLQGALVIHLRDNSTNTVFWKNTLSAEGKHRAEGEELKKRIQYAVDKMLAPLPAK
jgi:hypothetical protein